MTPPDPPRRRYTTRIEIDHHDLDELLTELHIVLTNMAVDWARAGDQAPYRRQIGGGRIIEITEHQGHVSKADYPAALDAWWRARKAEHAKEGTAS